MIENTLKKLGLSEKEITVYLCILEQGKITASRIARLTKLNRTTIYSVTKELLGKKIIAEDLGGVSRYFSALPLQELHAIYTDDAAALEQKKQDVATAITELSNLPKSTQYSVPKIRFIDEIRVGEFLHKQLPVWIESARKYKDKNWWGFQDPSLLEAYPEWVDYHWDILPEEFGMKVFTNKKQAETKLAKKYDANRRQIKYWNKATDFSATHVVLGDYVIFIMTREHPHYLVETHDVVMADNLRQMFQGIWNNIK